MIVEERAALRHENVGNPPELADALHNALPGDVPDRLAPILPDLIGEGVALAELTGRTAEQQGATVRRAYARAPAETLAAVIRTAQDYARTDEHPALLWLDELAQATGDLGALIALVDQLPQQTTSLRGRAAAFQAAIVALLRSVPEDMGGEEWRNRLAGALNNLGVRLGALGRREEALAAAQEATQLYRELAAARPQAFNPELAGSLSNLGIRLSELGRREEALAAAQEAVALRRELAASRPDAFQPDLAQSLSVLADCLEASDRLDEARSADTKAVAALSPHFLALPAAFAGLMAAIVRGYMRRCKKGGSEPDAELLLPIIEVFQKMRVRAVSRS